MREFFPLVDGPIFPWHVDLPLKLLSTVNAMLPISVTSRVVGSETQKCIKEHKYQSGYILAGAWCRQSRC